jgi:hypothetical protein
MSIDELRAFCLALPGTHENLTWGDAEHEGTVSFRVRDRIYFMTSPRGDGASIRTTIEQQADLMDAFPGAFASAAYVGRFGWVSVDIDAVDADILRGVIEGAWRRTAPKAVVTSSDGRAGR